MINNSYRNLNPDVPLLDGNIVVFFYEILVNWELNKKSNGDRLKDIKKFNSAEIKRFLNRVDSSGNKEIYLNKTPDDTEAYRASEIRFIDSQKNKSLSLLYHLRNAFAHNDISYDIESNVININHFYKKKLRIKGSISFNLLLELVETIFGKYDMNTMALQNYRLEKRKRKMKKV